MNLFCALFNLLPLSGFDGSRVLSALLLLLLPPHIATAICHGIALVTAIFFYFFALFMTFLAGGGVYIFLLALFLMWSEAGRHAPLWQDF